MRALARWLRANSPGGWHGWVLLVSAVSVTVVFAGLHRGVQQTADSGRRLEGDTLEEQLALHEPDPNTELVPLHIGSKIQVIGAGDISVNGEYSSGPFDPKSPHSLALAARPKNWEKPGSIYFLKVSEEASYFPHRIAWWPGSSKMGQAGWYIDQGIRGMYWHPGGGDGVILLGNWKVYTGPHSHPGAVPAPVIAMKGHERPSGTNMWLNTLMFACVIGCLAATCKTLLKRRRVETDQTGIRADDGLDDDDVSDPLSQENFVPDLDSPKE